jgi:hypothetical protein
VPDERFDKLGVVDLNDFTASPDLYLVIPDFDASTPAVAPTYARLSGLNDVSAFFTVKQDHVIFPDFLSRVHRLSA